MMRDLVALEIRRLHQAVTAANRKIALSNIPGKVFEVDPGKRKLRLKIGETSEGKPVLSPWVRWQEQSVGGLNVHSEPPIGMQMNLNSASGVVGEGTIAMPASYDDDNQSPSNSSDTAVFERGAGRIELGPNGILLKGNVKAVGGTLYHNDKNVGDDHVHTNVVPGVALSGDPA